MRTKKKVAKKPSPEELDKEREQRAESFKAELEQWLDELAERRRTPTIPVQWIRMNLLARGGGNPLEAFLAAVREGK